MLIPGTRDFRLSRWMADRRSLAAPSRAETPPPAPGTLTRWLRAWHGGEARAGDRAVAGAYHELVRIAVGLLRHERPDHTLEPTALVHETYLRLTRSALPRWRDRTHFFVVATRIMRRILIDHGKGRRRDKRGGGWVRATWAPEAVAAPAPAATPGGLADAIRRLAAARPRAAAVAVLRQLVGLSVAETAAALRCSERTVAREWRAAQAWLACRLTPP